MKGKKDFTGGLSSLLGDTTQPEGKNGLDQHVTQSKEITKASQIGTKEEEIRATFIVNESLLEKVKAIAYWDRVQIKNVIADALVTYINQYETKNGPIQSVPSKGKHEL